MPNYANNYTTSLTAGITAGATSCTVASAAGMPPVPFTAVIAAEGSNADEVVYVTAVSGTTLTIQRAYEPTSGSASASAHGQGAVLAAAVTAGTLTPSASAALVSAYNLYR